MKKNAAKGIIFCTALMFALTACKKDVDYDVENDTEGLSEYTSEDEEKNESGKNVENSGSEDGTQNLQDTFYSSTNGGLIEVDAEIKRQQGITNYPVAKLKSRAITDTDIKKMAEVFFDENSVSVVDFFETGEDMSEIKWYEQDRDDGEIYRYCHLTGTRNGIWMDMGFTDSIDGQNTSNGNVAVSISQTSEYGRGFNLYNGDEENTCTYTKEQALDVANSFLSELGLEGYTDVNIGNAEEYVSYGADGISYSVNGWLIDYRRSVNGATMPYADFVTSIDEEYSYEHIKLAVTDDGVMELLLFAPSEVEEISTDAAVLLSFDDMNQMAKTYFENDYLVNNNLEAAEEPMEINVIELGKAQVTGEDGSSYLVPAWYYEYDSSNGIYEKNVIAVFNAIDGSVIK